MTHRRLPSLRRLPALLIASLALGLPSAAFAAPGKPAARPPAARPGAAPAPAAARPPAATRPAAASRPAVAATPGATTSASDDDDGGRQRKQAEKREARRRAALERAGVDAARADKAIAVMKRHDAARQPHARVVREQAQSLRQLLREESADQAAYAKALTALRTARSQLHSIRERELTELGQILKPSEQAHLLRQALRGRHRHGEAGVGGRHRGEGHERGKRGDGKGRGAHGPAGSHGDDDGDHAHGDDDGEHAHGAPAGRGDAHDDHDDEG